MIRLENRSKRRELRLWVTVMGEDVRGRSFTEETQTLNVSGGGLAFGSDHTLLVGAKVVLAIEIPKALRRYFKGRELYRVRAAVCRVEPRAALDLPARVGVRFLGEVL